MVTSIAPILEQHMPRAQARAGGQNTYSAFDFCAYVDSMTSTAHLTKQTPARSEYTFTNCTGANLSNQQFSITAITDSTGAISERYAYSAYGQPTILDASGSMLSASAISNRYTYSGREWDATLGLHHFRARWMSPIAGRFLTRDPIGYEGSPGNIYEYLQGMVLISLDPAGFSKCCVNDFKAPEGKQDQCVVKTDGKNQFLRFDLETTASFFDHDHAKECCCFCCSYRQYVKGGFKVTIIESGGAAIDPIPVKEPGDRWDDDFIEDCIIQDDGTRLCYGYRTEDWVNSNYIDKCNYASRDPLGLNLTGYSILATTQNRKLKRPLTITFCIELDIKAVIIDTCNGDAEIQSKISQIRCCKKVTVK